MLPQLFRSILDEVYEYGIKNAFTWIVAFLLVFVVFSVVFTDTVVANDGFEDEFESDNGKALYLQDGRTEPYYYNYTDVVVEEALYIPYPDVGNWFSYDTETTLDVLATTVDGGGEYTRVFLHVSAAGGYSYNETESVEHPHDDLSPPGMGHIGNAGQVIEAEITDYDGNHIPYLDIERSKNSGTTSITDGDEGGDGETSETQKLALQGALFAAQIGATAVDVKTFGAISAVSFAYTLATRGSDDEPNPFPENKDYDLGEDANVRQVWKHDPEMSEWNDTSGRMENPLEDVHGTSTVLYLSLDNDDLHESAILEISARNLLGISGYDDDEYFESSITDGAEATIEIPIRKARPELSLDTDKDTYYKSDYITSDDGPYIVSPKFDISLDNPAGDNTPKYDITMDIKFDGSSYETLTYFFYRDIDDDISQYITIEVLDGYDGSVSIKFTVETRYERYGGWIETFEISESFNVVEDGRDDSDDGGSGGGTPPPGGVVSTGNETPLEGG